MNCFNASPVKRTRYHSISFFFCFVTCHQFVSLSPIVFASHSGRVQVYVCGACTCMTTRYCIRRSKLYRFSIQLWLGLFRDNTNHCIRWHGCVYAIDLWHAHSHMRQGQCETRLAMRNNASHGIVRRQRRRDDGADYTVKMSTGKLCYEWTVGRGQHICLVCENQLLYGGIYDGDAVYFQLINTLTETDLKFYETPFSCHAFEEM